MSRTDARRANAWAIAATAARSRPSETFGTDSTSVTRLLYDDTTAPLRVTETPPSTTLPARRHRSIRSLQQDLARCRRCAEAGFRIESPPVVCGRAGRRAFLFGQAPGVVEGAEGAPWRGRAGRTLRRWLELDEDAFYSTFYFASVTRCYPGRDSTRGDRTPSPAERRLCEPWWREELRLLHAQLVLTVGGLATRAITG